MARHDPSPKLPPSPIATRIWDMKYRLKGPDGTPIDGSVSDTWRRVAKAAAEPEAPKVRALWAERFFKALEGYRFLPAGRILAGAGTGRSVTLFNCFVMGRIPDDMAGIFENLKEAAVTMQRGGGIGFDFSTLRPKGATVHGIGAQASGPLSFMDVWDAMCRTIMSAGQRRGAMMATLSCSHPDIEAFIDAKRDPGRLRMFNLSVLVTDAFMEAVKNDLPWGLSFEGTVYKTVSARALFERIMRATYEYAEPGVVFIDRINAKNNLYYCETISSTNPCVPADTWVMTADGPRQVAELIGRPFRAVVDGTYHASGAQGFFPTGVKPSLRLTTREGHVVRLTANHPLRKVVRRTRWSCDTAWAEASQLQPGDEIILHDHRALRSWGAAARATADESEGYLLGLLIGGGTLKSDKAVLSVWKAAAAANGEPICGGDAVMARAVEATRRLGHRAGFAGFWRVEGRDEWRLATAGLKRLAETHGLAPGRKTITDTMERRSSAFHAGLLRGLFDTDGSIQGTQQKGVSVRLAQSDLTLLRRAQRMLLRLGIASTIYENRRPAGQQLMPDGKGGAALYPTRAQHELVIAGDNLAQFAERIGFVDGAKSARLKTALMGYVRMLNRERFLATVERIEPDGEETVYDVSIPGPNAFDANGLYAHNCGEQPLPSYGACLLGSINLARLVQHPFTKDAALDEGALAALAETAVRFLDNVIDISPFPLEAQRQEAQAKRRIGLGVTGLADALIMCGVRYGAPESCALTGRWLKAIERAAYLASAKLAAEKGAFPLFDREPYLAGETVKGLDADMREAIAANGIRNGLLTSIAPTGTISLFADNVSSGVEPPFSFSYTRRVLLPDGSHEEEKVEDYAFRLYKSLKGADAPLPDYFVSTQTITPEDHLAIEAAAQAHVDASISKTINVPESISFDAFKDVYAKAFALGLKGCTTFRPNKVTGAVLALEPPGAFEAEPAQRVPAEMRREGAVVYMTEPLARPGVLPGRTYKLRWPEAEHALYVTINDVMQDGRRRPFEVFINSKNMEHYQWTVALTLLISAVFRRGGDVSFVADELKAVFDPRGGQWMEGHYVPSLLAAIGEILEKHMLDIGFLAEPAAERAAEPLRLAEQAGGGARTPESPRLRFCPRCFSPGLVRQENCDVCISCGYSKCA